MACSKTAEKWYRCVAFRPPIAGPAETPTPSPLTQMIFGRLVRADGAAAAMLTEPDQHAEKAATPLHEVGSKLLAQKRGIPDCQRSETGWQRQPENRTGHAGSFAFFLSEKQDGAMQTAARFENVDQLGSFGSIVQIH